MSDTLAAFLWLLGLVALACLLIEASEGWARFKQAQDDLPDAGPDDTQEFPAVSDEAA